MASFKKFLTYTAVAAVAVAGGIAVYKKVQSNKTNCDNDFDDFEDDVFDDDFDDDFNELEDGRNYTSITTEDAVSTEDSDTDAEVAPAQDAETTDAE